jgi:signal transduction histidine kinase
MVHDLGLEWAGEDAALSDWRRKAVNIVTATSVLLHFPPIILILLGFDPTIPKPLANLTLGCYLVTVAIAFLRRIDYRIRVWALLSALYLFASIGIAVIPQGPYIRAVPIIAPMLAIGLIGVRASRIATLTSAIVLLFSPFLQTLPGMALILGIHPAQPPVPMGANLIQGAGLTADMVILMVLLERFYGFLLQALGAQRCATADLGAANLNLEEEMRERRRLEREIARVGDEERRHLGYEVHDGVCQQLTGALLRCEALERRLGRGAPVSREEIGALSSLLEATIDEAHAVAEGLCPLEPDPEALVPALRALAKRTQHTSAMSCSCEFITRGEVSVPDATTAHHLYRIAQEALSNAVRHAHAGRIEVELSGTEDVLTLRVEDNGAGMPDCFPAGGMGLRTMDYRAQMMEGKFTIEPGLDGGTRILCRLPCSAFVRQASKTQLSARGNEP